MSASPQGRETDFETLRSARFRKEREAGWRRLETLIATAEKSGVRGLSYQETLELSGLYRQAVNSLSAARAISMDKALLTYLDRLCARAYLVVYAPQESIGDAVWRLFAQGIPQAVRRSGVALLIGFLAMALGALIGYTLFQRDPAWFFTFVPAELADGRTPEATPAYLRQTLYDTSNRSGEVLGVFASYLFSHNTQVAILIFALGVFAALPSFILTFYNGLLLGPFAAIFINAGLGWDLFGWLSIHGVTELAAICIACAGGARLGLAVLLPGRKSRRASLRDSGRDAVKLLILAGVMLIVAGLVEGFLRQLIHPTEWRLIIGWGLGLIWLSWLTLAGRGGKAS
ncbi:stage II sporulation protein M [Hoeflea poritis]|uniref:Stage II sporulation protein M n=1 Tax=Hoeflea poritis TaxID=2993659 RepID=A0ABT4VUE9_9HYPH|nr:stage II sporulation protein M [Hoeflea poritis]MDA4848337.1 stage II sporulation protein M [Hoeflea poritis]